MKCCRLWVWMKRLQASMLVVMMAGMGLVALLAAVVLIIVVVVAATEGAVLALLVAAVVMHCVAVGLQLWSLCLRVTVLKLWVLLN